MKVEELKTRIEELTEQRNQLVAQKNEADKVSQQCIQNLFITGGAVSELEKLIDNLKKEKS